MSTLGPGGRPHDDAALRAAATALVEAGRGLVGEPRQILLAGDAARACYLLADDEGDDRQALWMFDPDSGARRLVHPDDLGGEGLVPDVERARRERSREHAQGITAAAASRDLSVVTFAHAGRLHVVHTADGTHRTLDVPGPVVDPRPSPTGTHVAWCADGGLWVAGIDGRDARALAAEDDAAVTWGLAEFVAAEEMDRSRGYWWSPDGATIVACRVDVRPVGTWWLHEPAAPEQTPVARRYPAAGGANADVTLALFGLDGERTDVGWDASDTPYLTSVSWDHVDQGPLVGLQTRDQRRLDVCAVDRDGALRVLRRVHGDPWITLVPGTPTWTPDGRLVTVEDDVRSDTRRVHVDGRPLSPPNLHVDAVLAARSDDLVVRGGTDDPTTTAIWSVPRDGAPPVAVTPEDGIHEGVANGDTIVVRSERLDDTVGRTRMVHPGGTSPMHERRLTLPVPRPRFARLDGLHMALLLPSWYDEGHGPLPVLLDPYGGPHVRRVRASARAWLTGQWFADAGFAVVTIDGRGTPGRGLRWEHAVAQDLAGPPLDDQCRGLEAAAGHWPVLDRSRVGIRGWSFGGFLAALAVLRRPDVVHAAVAGAPVTDWRLYDTHYTERYLGDPADGDDAYRRSSLLGDAEALRRPLLLLHGLSDDNVVAAHTLRLSQALVAAGRPHTVLPLSHTTHVTRGVSPQVGLLRIQLAFLRTALATEGSPAPSPPEATRVP